MMMRRVLRGFKSWPQYQAERLGMSERDLLRIRDSVVSGPYESWKQENSVTQKLKFILDHCTAEEQKLYLKEFTTVQLGKFLLKEIGSLSNDDLNRLKELSVQAHPLPVVSQLYKMKNFFKAAGIVGNENLNRQQVDRNIAKLYLEEKLKELEWRNLDKEIAGSA